MSAGIKRGGVRADSTLNGQSIERYMDGERQGKEMRWDTERQRENMKIYDGTHKCMDLQTIQLSVPGHANSIEDELMESSNEMIFEASCWPAH